MCLSISRIHWKVSKVLLFSCARRSFSSHVFIRFLFHSLGTTIVLRPAAASHRTNALNQALNLSEMKKTSWRIIIMINRNWKEQPTMRCNRMWRARHLMEHLGLDVRAERECMPEPESRETKMKSQFTCTMIMDEAKRYLELRWLFCRLSFELKSFFFSVLADLLHTLVVCWKCHFSFSDAKWKSTHAWLRRQRRCSVIVSGMWL